MSVLLQISDPHFGTEQPPVVEALVDFAGALKPSLVVLSGDVTQRARRAQYARAAAFVARLPRPLVAVPGNHDIPLYDLWTRCRRPYARHAGVFGADLEPVHDAPPWLVVCLNTTRPRRHKHGEVSARQIERAAALAARARPDQLRIVVVHQPAAVIREEDRVNLLRGHLPALRQWAAAGVDLVMGGHIHLPYVVPLRDFARPLWVVQAGTAVSRRIREGVPNSVNVVRWATAAGDTHGTIERWDYAAASQRFERVSQTRFEPIRG